MFTLRYSDVPPRPGASLAPCVTNLDDRALLPFRQRRGGMVRGHPATTVQGDGLKLSVTVTDHRWRFSAGQLVEPDSSVRRHGKLSCQVTP
jgi:hypothetical protein